MPVSGNLPILVISGVDPRGPRHGMLMRVERTVEALAELCPVEVAVVRASRDDSGGETGPFPSTMSRAKVFTFGRRLTAARRIAWFVRPSVPLNVVGRDTTQMRRELAAWMSPEYSLVWIIGTALHDAVAPVLPPCPVVVDVNDLESDKLAGELRVRQASTAPRGLVGRAQHEVALLQGRRNVGAWMRYDRAVARDAALTLVCSDDDAMTLGADRVAVVPNAYPSPAKELGRSAVGRPPTILFQGSMTYPPNIDAEHFLVREILPRIRAEVPGAQLRIVGRAEDEVRALADGDRVVVTGYVPDLDPELAHADLVVVPIRFGGGTRIKIIEAFAHGIPVVSTSVGAFGLGAVNGETILLADDADSFGAACVRALTDRGLRSTLASSGRACFERSYRVEVVEEGIIDLASSLVHGPGRPR